MKRLVFFAMVIVLAFLRGELDAQGWTDLGIALNNTCAANKGTGLGNDYNNYPFHDKCAGVVAGWGSAAVDTKRGRILMGLGGHSDYYGNDVFSLDLLTVSNTSMCTGTCQTNSGLPAIRRLTDPSVWDFGGAGGGPGTGGACTSTYCEANPDTTIVARHLYGGLVYLPKQDALFVMGTFRSPNATGTYHLWWFDLTTNTWADKDPTTGYDLVATYPNGANWVLSNYDQNTDSVFIALVGNPYKLMNYAPSTNTMTQLNATFQISGDKGAGSGTYSVLDPDRKRIYYIGSQNSDGTGGLWFRYVDISGNNTSYPLVDISSSVFGCGAANVVYPGLAYDPARGAIAIYPNNGNSVLFFNPTTGVCSTQTFSGGPPAGTAIGTFGRFAYVPATGAYYIVNKSINDAYKLVIDLNPSVGLGSSTYAKLDKDGDGYGDGPLAVGPLSDLTKTTGVNPLTHTSMLYVSGGSGGTAGFQNVTFSGGGGSGATGTIAVLNGVPTGAITITSQGSGYTSVPTSMTVATVTGTVTISGGFVNSSGGLSTGDTVYTYVSGGAGGTPGTQTVTFTNGGCTGAAGTMTVNGSGIPTGNVTITSTGSGCTSSPTQGTVATVTGTVTFGTGALMSVVCSAGHTFTVDDLSRLVNISGGAGLIPGSYYINKALNGCADLLSSPGADGSTGGVWSMDGTLGPDVDDFDATIHTTAQGITKYGSESALLAHLGFTPERSFYIDGVGGNNSTCAANDITKPCLTYAGIAARGYTVAGGDTIFYRDTGVYNNPSVTTPSGTYGHPVTVMGYPGEIPTFTGNAPPFNSINVSFQVFSGMRLYGSGGATNGPCMSGGTSSINPPSLTFNNTFTHMEGHLCQRGFQEFNGLIEHDIEDNILWGNWQGDGNDEHGIYIGSRGIPSGGSGSNGEGGYVIVRRNVSFRNELTGMQFNGRVKNLVMEHNLVVASVQACYSLDSGVSNSFLREGVCIAPGRAAITIANYTDVNCTPPTNYTGCPYDQTNNLIENMSAHLTGTTPEGNPSPGQPFILLTNTSPGTVGDLGTGNVLRNSIGDMFGAGSGYAPLVFPAVGTLNYIANWTFDTNTMFINSPPSTGSVMYGVANGSSITFGTTFTCAQYATAGVTHQTGCLYADPKFAAASVNPWQQPQLFNLKLLISSPGYTTGSTATPIPSYDSIGVTVPVTGLNQGAYEGAQGSPPVSQGGIIKGGKIASGGSIR